MHTLYHGTSSKNVPSIMQNGIEPGHAKGGDAWAIEHGMSVGRTSIKRGPQVFVSDKMKHAVDFANLAVTEVGGEPVILVLSVPEQTFAAFHVDELSHSSGDSVHEWRAARIEPSCIKEVKPAKVDHTMSEMMENPLIGFLSGLL